MLAINNSGDMTLCRIGLDGGQASLSVVASVKFDQGVSVGVGHSGEFITTTSPCPFLVRELTPSEKSFFSCSSESLIETPQRFQRPRHED